MNERIRMIREEESKYHESCYEQNKLFEEGSWLAKPAKTVMDALAYLDNRETLQVLDLGCGVGRNTIPIAQTLEHRSGTVICVDLLDSALRKLVDYCDEYNVSPYVQTYQSDIGDYYIPEEAFDLIVAVSALEHLDSPAKLEQVLERMARGTKPGGVNCIIMNTNIQEIALHSGDALDPLMELNLTTTEAEELFAAAYLDWSLCFTTVKEFEVNIERNQVPILMKSDCITYVVQRP